MAKIKVKNIEILLTIFLAIFLPESLLEFLPEFEYFVAVSKYLVASFKGTVAKLPQSCK
jgi:hypothetical protein